MVGRPRSVHDDVIFEAGADVVSAHGPGGLTLAAVASHVGLSAPALTQRFGSKRGLLLAFAAASVTAVDRLFEEAVANASGPVAAIRAALVAFTAPVGTRAAMANNLAFLQLDLTDPDLGRHAAEQSRLLRRRLTGLVAEGVTAGELLDVDAGELADTIYTVYNGALLTWAIDGRGALSSWLGARVDRVLGPFLASR